LAGVEMKKYMKKRIRELLPNALPLLDELRSY
jgi:hypothetical protein